MAEARSGIDVGPYRTLATPIQRVDPEPPTPSWWRRLAERVFVMRNCYVIVYGDMMAISIKDLRPYDWIQTEHVMVVGPCTRRQALRLAHKIADCAL